jgi:hypothetical protein
MVRIQDGSISGSNIVKVDLRLMGETLRNGNLESKNGARRASQSRDHLYPVTDSLTSLKVSDDGLDLDWTKSERTVLFDYDVGYSERLPPFVGVGVNRHS